MKKIIIILCVACVMIGILSACSEYGPILKNEISPKKLTTNEQEIVDLLSSDTQEILLFDYKTEDAYKTVSFWVEFYENGELIDRPSGIESYNDEAKPQDGQLAVLITHDEGVTWAFTKDEDGSRTSHTGEILEIDYASLARGYRPINNPVEIEAGKEIVLYTSIYSNDGISLFSDMQRYIEEPNLLSGYPYVQIIKCRFE
ncbi:MAG: hypothetical protein LBH39_03255 [Clostridiales Family XIII bacterium]|jgi:hypothetical protein|nr:hypothetical protein [Clostridiales Family XIII bacterium]